MSRERVPVSRKLGTTVVALTAAAVAVLCLASVSLSAQRPTGRFVLGASLDVGEIACPNPHQCTTVRLTRGVYAHPPGSGGEAITFNPFSASKPSAKLIDDPGPRLTTIAMHVACLSRLECVAVDDYGREVTFDPVSGVARARVIDGNGTDQEAINGIAGPSASQCTAWDATQMTFDPASPSTVSRAAFAGRDLGQYESCPTVTECVGVSTNSDQETAFDPRSPHSETTWTLASQLFEAIACPSATQCTAIGGPRMGSQGPDVAITFNPHSPHGRLVMQLDYQNEGIASMFGLACPTTTQCTAVGTDPTAGPSNAEVTFNPRTTATAGVMDLPSYGGDYARFVACPSRRQCTLTDVKGGEVTFDPVSGKVLPAQ